MTTSDILTYKCAAGHPGSSKDFLVLRWPDDFHSFIYLQGKIVKITARNGPLVFSIVAVNMDEDNGLGRALHLALIVQIMGHLLRRKQGTGAGGQCSEEELFLLEPHWWINLAN